MFSTQYFEEYEEGSKRISFGRTITETDFVQHAGQTGDFFPHHMDAEWCKTQPFKQRIAHGTLVFSIAIGLTASVVNPVSMTYGYDRLRFIHPVFIGDTITVTVIVKEKSAAKSRSQGKVTEAVEVYNQQGRLVMVCEHILLVERKKQEHDPA